MAELKINVTETGITKVKNSIKSLDTTVSKVDSNISRTSKTMSSFNSIALKAGAAIAGLVAINTVASAFVSFNKSIISTTATFEKFNSILTTVEGSSAKAKESLDWISTFASTTPFQLEQVAQSFTSLRAYGIDPTNGSLKTLGDTASAMGKDVQQAVEALADAVVGENERLKEFGIRASVQGEQIKYTWTNASGEARQKIIENNSAIIESTLLSIFNSKYEGAMEDMSKTWIGMVSNLQDNWTIFTKNIGESGLFDYFKAILTVVGDEFNKKLEGNESIYESYAKYMIEVTRDIILGIGNTIDVLETIGDAFKVVWYSGTTAFYGIQVVTATVSRFIQESFEDAFNGIIEGMNSLTDKLASGFENVINGIISGINLAISGINMLGGNLSYLENVTLSGVKLDLVDFGIEELLEREASVKVSFEAEREKLLEAYDDYFTLSGAGDFAENLVGLIDKEYEKLQLDDDSDSGTVKPDFGDPVAEEFKDFTNDLLSGIVETVIGNESELEASGESFSDYIDSVAESEDVYTVITEANNTATDSSYDLADAISDVSDAVEDLTIQFQDEFINSLTSSASALSDIIGTTSSISESIFGGISYEEALAQAISAQQASSANPLNEALALSFSEAIDTLSDSASTYLDTSNFASTKDYQLAQLTVANQMEAFGDVSVSQEDLLVSISELIAETNTSLEDGIITDAEIESLNQGSEDIIAKNEELLGYSGAIAKTIDIQEYYNNVGLAQNETLNVLNDTMSFTGLSTINAINEQEYYNNQSTIDAIYGQTYFDNGNIIDAVSGITLDNTDVISAINTQTYYDNTGLAKDQSLIGSNSLSSILTQLSGAKSIADIVNVSDDIATATGLTKSAVINTTSAVNNTYAALGGASSGGVGLDNLQVKKIDYQNMYYGLFELSKGSDAVWKTTTNPSYYYSASNVQNLGIEGQTYTYYSKGGYTGHGGKYEEAGIVHKGEYVVNQEDLKSVGGVGAVEAFLNGQGTTTVSNGVTMPNNNKLEYEVSELKGYIRTLVSQNMDLTRMFRNVTDGGTFMQVELAQ